MNKNGDATEVSEIDSLLCHTTPSDFSINKSERKVEKAQLFFFVVFLQLLMHLGASCGATRRAPAGGQRGLCCLP